MKNSIVNLETLCEFGVEEISLNMMEEVVGGDNPWYDLGVLIGIGIVRMWKVDQSVGIPFAA